MACIASRIAGSLSCSPSSAVCIGCSNRPRLDCPRSQSAAARGCQASPCSERRGSSASASATQAFCCAAVSVEESRTNASRCSSDSLAGPGVYSHH
eukprot:3329314-Prymnesium_polylepis.1